MPFLAWAILIAVLFSGCTIPVPQVNSKCASGFIIKCYKDSVVTKESISCSSNEDCAWEKIANACSSGYSDMNACGEGPGISPYHCINNACIWLPGV